MDVYGPCILVTCFFNMKWYFVDESSAPSSSISVIGSKFGVHVYFVFCLILVCFGVMGTALFCEVVGYKLFQVL